MINLLDSTRSIQGSLPSTVARKALKSDFSISSHNRYMTSSLKYRNLADSLQKALPLDDKHFVFRAWVVNFLNHVKTSEERSAINFIKNLTTLANAGVDGVERLLMNVIQAEMDPNKTIQGYTNEARVAVNLLENGFTVSSLSVREFSLEDNGKIQLKSSDGKKREIDIIAKKEIDGEMITFFIEVKSSIETLKDKDNANGQIKALVELAKKFDAVPAVILKTYEQTFWRNGAIKDIKHRVLDHKELIRFLRKNSDLLIWDENGNDIVLEDELLK